MTDYTAFLAARRDPAQAAGFTVDPAELHPSLFPFQRRRAGRTRSLG